MKVYATKELPTYQLIGDVVRVHWNGEQVQTTGIDEIELQWCYDELVVPKTYTPAEALANGVPPELAAKFTPSNFVEDQNAK